MSIEVNCQACGSSHQINDRLAGKRVRCPQCDAVVQVPRLPEPVEEVVSVGSQVAEPIMEELLSSPPADSLLSRGSPSPVVPAQAVPLPSAGMFVEDDDPDLKREKRKEDELDMTPMVDVTFLLLIFFMVTASFSLQKSIRSPRQQSDAPSMNTQPEETEELDAVTVQINEYGSFLVLGPDWERETPGKQNLIRALREAMGDGNNPMKLTIEVHEAAKLQSLVDCMDAGTICNYGEMQVTQVDGFD